MHFVASRTRASTKASVGHASRQRVQLPHLSASNCASAEITFQNGSGVDISLPVDRTPSVGLDLPVQLLELYRHDIVVVVTPGVSGNGSGRLSAPVTQTDDNRTRRAYKWK